MSRTQAEFERVKQLISDGLSDYTIAGTTGIPRSTVGVWRRRDDPPRSASRRYPWPVNDPDAVCYVLGCYLGDGHVTQRSANGWELRIACDQRYPGIIAKIEIALVATFPWAQPTRFAASTGASDAFWCGWGVVPC